LPILLGLCCSTAAAAVWVVDTQDEGIDVAPGDGTCADGSARCSLRAAIMESNAHAGADEVWLRVGEDSYRPDMSHPDTDSAAVGDVDIHADLVLRRHPLDAARISEIAKLNDTFTTPNRIFDIRPPARVYMSDAVVAFGRLSAPDS